MWNVLKKFVDICLVIAAVYVFTSVYFEVVRSSSDRTMSMTY